MKLYPRVMDILVTADSLTGTHKEVKHGDQGQEHEEEHGKETGSEDAEREAAGQEGEEIVGPGRAARAA
jgi:hypothetical protein